MATQALAKWAANIDIFHLPPEVETAAKRSLYNYIGCAIGGSHHPTVTKAYEALSPFFGSATSTVFGHSGTRKADAPHAALSNGISSHVHDYDDTHLETIIHPAGPVASALLAFAEYKGGVSGDDLLCALTAGIESSCKLGLSVWPSHYDVGWHITSTTGSVGAAVAVGKLMKLDEQRMAHAIGIAAVQVVGLREMFGSDTKSFHPGRAVQNGLLAAVLAEKDYTSSPQALEAKRGWANVVVAGGTPKLAEYLGELGSKWEIESNAFKPFPCGIVCHPAIDACIHLNQEMQGRDLKAEDIANVDEKVHPLVIELTSKRKPKDGLEGKFSVFHGSAVGLLYGKAGPAQYQDEVVTSDQVVTLRDKIDARSDTEVAADEARLVVRFKDGQKLEKHVRHAIGSLKVPMSDEQLTEKFIDQCSPVLGGNTARISEAVWNLGNVKDIAEQLAALKV